MLINKKYVLTYCSNIFKTKSLKKLVLNIKNYTQEFKYHKNHTSICLSKNLLAETKIKHLFLLKKNHISSINGFVYQDFHKKNIKEKIYLPDWTSKYRFLYTQKIISIIKNYRKIKNIISISTMPISYKEWIKKKQKPIIIYKSIKNIEKTHPKKNINISIEPEPYCLIECYLDVINFYTIWIKKIIKKFKKYICICYDICHFSVIFDKHEIALNSINKKHIKIGKIQISSALKIILPTKINNIKLLLMTFLKMKKSNFLHQCITKYKENMIIYNDIAKIIKNLINLKNSEIRIHCHIPIYKKKFKYLNTTNSETKKTIRYIKKQNKIKNLEIESYTYHLFFKKFCYTKSIKKEHEITIQE